MPDLHCSLANKDARQFNWPSNIEGKVTHDRQRMILGRRFASGKHDGCIVWLQRDAMLKNWDDA